MMCFIDSLSPPGVSMVINTSAAWRCAASTNPSSTYVARIGSTSPSIFNSSTTFEDCPFSTVLAAASLEKIPTAANNTAHASATRPPNRAFRFSAHPKILVPSFMAKLLSAGQLPPSHPAGVPAIASLPHNWEPASAPAPLQPAPARFFFAPGKLAPAWCAPPPIPAPPAPLVAPSPNRPACPVAAQFPPAPCAPPGCSCPPPAPRDIHVPRHPADLRKAPAAPAASAQQA